MKRVDTIIIGAGVSGLACARTLHAQKKGFIIISSGVGGRIVRSKDDRVNYGAYVLPADFVNISKFSKRGRALKLWCIMYHDGVKAYSFAGALQYPRQLATMFVWAHRFMRAYHRFQSRVPEIGQRRALESEPLLVSLRIESANHFLERTRTHQFADRFISPIVRMCTFSPISALTAFEYMHIAMYLARPVVYEFSINIDALAEGFRDQIIANTIVAVDYVGSGYNVKTDDGNIYNATHLVIATEPWNAAKLMHGSYDRTTASCYLFHVKGRVRKRYNRGALEVFCEPSDILFLSRQSDNSFLVYALSEKPELTQLFDPHLVIAHRHWNPAFGVGSAELPPENSNGQKYIIGDHSIVGMEDAYLTGVHAARTIIASS